MIPGGETVESPHLASANDLVVVKLGGSILTRKGQAERLRPKILNRLGREVAETADRRIILLHGAGSFGHPSASRFGLASPPKSGVDEKERARRARGAAIVSSEVRRLHASVIDSLLRGGASPISVPPATHAVNRAGELVSLSVQPLSDTIRRGGLPVSFGDVVPDEEWGFSILSADTIAVELARTLHPRSVIFVSDVPGILGPGRSGRGEVIPQVTEAVIDGLVPRGNAPDVTGGIRAKAQAMLAISRFGVDAGLISGLKDGALSRAIRGESVYGSWSEAKPPGVR